MLVIPNFLPQTNPTKIGFWLKFRSFPELGMLYLIKLKCNTFEWKSSKRQKSSTCIEEIFPSFYFNIISMWIKISKIKCKLNCYIIKYCFEWIKISWIQWIQAQVLHHKILFLMFFLSLLWSGILFLEGSEFPIVVVKVEGNLISFCLL